MVDGKMLSYLVTAYQTDGSELLQMSHLVMTRGSAERTAALRTRFATQSPGRRKEQLLHSFQIWRANFEELLAAGSSPSKETVLRSLTLLISGCGI